MIKSKDAEYFHDDVNNIVSVWKTFYNSFFVRDADTEKVLTLLPEDFMVDYDRLNELTFSHKYDPVLVRYDFNANIPVKSSSRR